MKIINTGLIGYGMSGRVFHAPFLHVLPGFRLAGVVERHAAESKQRYPDVTVVDDAGALFGDIEIDLVVITTPNTTHFDLARRALEAGKHVILEKPFTITTDEADRLIETARRANRTLSVFQNRRWDDDFQTVREVIVSGRLGRLVEYVSRFDRFRNYNRPNAWREEDHPGSGILYDLGPHLIDQAILLFGLPGAITADIRKQRDRARVDDYFSLTLHYPDLKVTLQAGMLVREPTPRFTLYGTKGTYVSYGLDPQEAALKNGVVPAGPGWAKPGKDHYGLINTEENGQAVRDTVALTPGTYGSYYRELYKALVGETAPPVTAREARTTIYLIECALQSHRERRTIDIRS